MRTIPIQAVQNQTVTVNLAGQSTQINVYQKSTGLYCDVYLNNALILAGVLCQNKVRIVRDAYFGFVGDLGFVDQQGSKHPDYTGLGSRWLLYYLEASNLAAGF